MIFMKKDELRKLLSDVDKETYSHVILSYNEKLDKYMPMYCYRKYGVYELINRIRGVSLGYEVVGIFNLDMDIEMQINDYNPFYIETIDNKKNDELETKALEFASKKHEGQYRKSIDHKPYIEHPKMVADLIEKYKGHSHAIDELKAASYLHDTCEDTETTFEELVKNFGIQVASLVMELTNINEFKDIIGKAKYQAISLSHMSNWALDIKLCDILANLSDLTDIEDEDFIKRVISDKTYIIWYQVKNRSLTETQKNIIADIVNILRIINTNKYPENQNSEEYKYLLESLNEKK